MKYMILIYADEKAWASFSPEEQTQGLAAYFAYNDALRAAGKYIMSHELNATSTAKTIMVRAEKAQVKDGPYADTKEQLGGYYLIEADDQADAETWARKCPGAEHGTVELRPIIEH